MWRREPVLSGDDATSLSGEKKVATDSESNPKTQNEKTDTPAPTTTRLLSFTRAVPPTRASWHGSHATTPYRYDVYSRGLGVSIEGVLGGTRVRSRDEGSEPRGTETADETAQEWEWQGQWQREWQSALESVKSVGAKEYEGEALDVATTALDVDGTGTDVDVTGREVPHDDAADDAAEKEQHDDKTLDAVPSPTDTGYTLSPSPTHSSRGAYSASPFRVGRNRGQGETQNKSYEQLDSSNGGATPLARGSPAPRGSPSRSPASVSPSRFALTSPPEFGKRPTNANTGVSSSPAPRLKPYAQTVTDSTSLSYRERRDLRKSASLAGDENEQTQTRTGLDVRGGTTGERGVFF